MAAEGWSPCQFCDTGFYQIDPTRRVVIEDIVVPNQPAFVAHTSAF